MFSIFLLAVFWKKISKIKVMLEVKVKDFFDNGLLFKARLTLSLITRLKNKNIHKAILNSSSNWRPLLVTTISYKIFPYN